jgi:hypothetical protein
MAIVSQESYYEQFRSKSIAQFAKDFNLAQFLARANIRKAKGVGVLTIFLRMVAFGFSGKSMNQSLQEADLDGKKDVFYRFMNSTSANWSKFIRLLSSCVIVCILKLTPPQMPVVLILDDTLDKRNRSKKVELLTRVRDHNNGRYYRGFRCLTLGFHDGKTFLPIDFRLLSSQKEETRICDMRQDLDKRSNGYKIRQDAISNTVQMAFAMIRRANSLARHVLFDSWFAEPVMFQTLRQMDMHGIGMLKAKKGRLYLFKGKYYTLEALYALVKPLIPRKKGFAAIGVELRDGTPLSITFIRDKHSKRDWLAIGTTDLSLSPEQVISLYARRWNIEVFFKTVKSCLRFARDCQSRSFDALVCSVAVVFTRYIIMAWSNQGLSIPKTDGQLFLRLFDEFHEPTLDESLAVVLRELKKCLVEFDRLLDLSLRDLLALLPCHFNILRALACCET